MNEPEGPGSDRDPEPPKKIVLPSWIDAAITRSKDDEEAEPGNEGWPSQAHGGPTPLPEEAVEPMPDEPPTEEVVRPFGEATRLPEVEPFPTFLDRRGSMEYETERIAEQPEPATEDPFAHEAESGEVVAHEPVARESVTPTPPAETVLRDFLSRKVSEDFDAQRAAIVTQAMAEETGPAPEPIPLPVAPPRRRMPTGPWLMAALFFAAAALVLAVLIWLRPIPQ